MSKVLFYDQNEEYKGFKNTEKVSFEFHPHVLKQYNRRWFIFGYNKTKNIDEWSIPLDERIIDFKILEDKDYIATEKDYYTMFRSRVGIIKPKDANIKRVVLRFYNSRENYFKSKPFQPDYDEFFEEDKQNQVWFDCIINRELVQQILSYGKDVEVLEPLELKLEVKNHVNCMMKFYE